MNYLKKIVTEPQYPFIIFVCATSIIWTVSKFHKPRLSEAFIYSGEPISSNSIGKLVVSEGIVIKSYRSKQGIQFLNLKGQKGEYTVSFFPSLGELSYVPDRGDLVKITGLLNIYKKQTQISPLSYQSITKIIDKQSSISDNSNPYRIVDIKELGEYMGQTVWINNLYPKKVEKFTSKKGYKMLRFQANSSDGLSIEGVFFEGNWDKNTVDIMRSSKKRISILATVSEFNRKISLNAKRVKYE